MTAMRLFLLFPLLLLGCEAPTVPPPTAVSPAPVAEAASSAEGVFAAAIRGRRPIAFDYSGVSRVAHPHRMGASAAGNGKTLVRCWEVRRGDAATGQWKLYDVDKIRAPRLLPGAPFAPAAGYTPRDRAIPSPEMEIPVDTQEGTADFADWGRFGACCRTQACQDDWGATVDFLVRL